LFEDDYQDATAQLRTSVVVPAQWSLAAQAKPTVSAIGVIYACKVCKRC
jgi:hypothetical protein